MTLATSQVLIVDDDRDIRKILTLILRKAGVSRIVEADSGEAAVELIQNTKTPFDLTICDWMMAGLTGADVLKVFRKTYPSTPFVMLTAKTGAREFNEAKALGADYFFMKPLSLDDLTLRLGTILSKL